MMINVRKKPLSNIKILFDRKFNNLTEIFLFLNKIISKFSN